MEWPSWHVTDVLYQTLYVQSPGALDHSPFLAEWKLIGRPRSSWLSLLQRLGGEGERAKRHLITFKPVMLMNWRFMTFNQIYLGTFWREKMNSALNNGDSLTLFHAMIDKQGLISTFCDRFFEQPIKSHKIVRPATFCTEWKSVLKWPALTVFVYRL